MKVTKSSKYLYFVSNNKTPNLKFFLGSGSVKTYKTRSAARLALKLTKVTVNDSYKIFKVSVQTVT